MPDISKFVIMSPALKGMKICVGFEKMFCEFGEYYFLKFETIFAYWRRGGPVYLSERKL